MKKKKTFTFKDSNGKSLSEFAQLDTTVTVVDCSQFSQNMKCIQTLAERKEGMSETDDRTIYNLLARIFFILIDSILLICFMKNKKVDQIEFADVILLNKCDLVSEEDLVKVEKVVKCLNTEAKIYKTTNSKIDIDKVLGTGLFSFERAEKAAGWLKIA